MSDAPAAVQGRPAWTEPFSVDHRAALARSSPVDAPTAPWLTSRGAGITVAIIDSGVEGDHEAVGGKLVRS
ncbi:MAG TPA: hypothetical protein VHL56_02060, partial [Candidatus Limnocylindrales bacterium]|nr:hypothetical protein [Candidatus Limnocylindrales bacterium]